MSFRFHRKTSTKKKGGLILEVEAFFPLELIYLPSGHTTCSRSPSEKRMQTPLAVSEPCQTGIVHCQRDELKMADIAKQRGMRKSRKLDYLKSELFYTFLATSRINLTPSSKFLNRSAPYFLKAGNGRILRVTSVTRPRVPGIHSCQLDAHKCQENSIDEIHLLSPL